MDALVAEHRRKSTNGLRALWVSKKVLTLSLAVVLIVGTTGLTSWLTSLPVQPDTVSALTLTAPSLAVNPGIVYASNTAHLSDVVAQAPNDVGDHSGEMSCTSSTTCWVLSSYDNQGGASGDVSSERVLHKRVNGQWTFSTIVPGNAVRDAQQGLSCNADQCVVGAGGAGVLQVLDLSTHAWSSFNTGLGTSFQPLGATACAVQGDCLIFDSTGTTMALSLYSITAGTIQALTPPVALASAYASNALESVSCLASSDTCYIAGGDAMSSYDIATSTWGAVSASGTPIMALSCASATLCAANAQNGDELIYNGTDWTITPPVVPSGYSASGADEISCASATFCVGAVTFVDTATSLYWNEPVVWNGTSWSYAEAETPGNFTAFETNNCVATDECFTSNGGYDVDLFNGTSVSQVAMSPSNNITAIPCLNASASCYPIPFGAPLSSGLPSGATMIQSSAALLPYETAFSSPTQPALVVAGGRATAFGNDTGRIDLYNNLDDKTTGEPTYLGDYTVTHYLQGIACSPTEQMCLGVGKNGDTVALSTTSAPTTTSNPIDALNCVAGSTPWCLLVGTSSGDITLQVNGGSPSTTTIPGTPISESCVSDTMCMIGVSGAASTIYEYTGGSTLSASGPSGFTAPDVSCASTTFCLAVTTGSASTSLEYSTYNGTSWSTPAPIAISGTDITGPLTAANNRVSCATSTLCLIETNGSIDRYNGSSWAAVADPPSTTFPNSDYAGVACAPGGTKCVIGSHKGPYLSYYSSSAGISSTTVNVNTNGAFANNITDILPLGCVSDTSCAAIGLETQGAATAFTVNLGTSAGATTAQPLSTFDTATDTADNSLVYQDSSCSSQYQCWLQESPTTYASYDGDSLDNIGETSPSTHDLNAITCGGFYCIAVGAGGTVESYDTQTAAWTGETGASGDLTTIWCPVSGADCLTSGAGITTLDTLSASGSFVSSQTTQLQGVIGISALGGTLPVLEGDYHTQSYEMGAGVYGAPITADLLHLRITAIGCGVESCIIGKQDGQLDTDTQGVLATASDTQSDIEGDSPIASYNLFAENSGASSFTAITTTVNPATTAQASDTVLLNAVDPGALAEATSWYTTGTVGNWTSPASTTVTVNP